MSPSRPRGWPASTSTTHRYRFRETYGGDVETEVRYGTDVLEGIFAAAADVDASAIVFKPRGGSRWRQLMSGDVARELVTECDRPVIALPGQDDE